MFKGLGNIGNIASMMGAMQQVPEKLSVLNERMKVETVTMSSQCQRVTVVMSGVGQVQAIEIIEGTAGEELHIAIIEATNAAGTAAKQMYAEAISEMAGEMDLNVPGLDGMLAKLTGNA
tara:strand:+ start:30857 stop:31213 length:357 start_codon:yes stop_codon:yes gene_type:complete